MSSLLRLFRCWNSHSIVNVSIAVAVGCDIRFFWVQSWCGKWSTASFVWFFEVVGWGVDVCEGLLGYTIFPRGVLFLALR